MHRRRVRGRLQARPRGVPGVQCFQRWPPSPALHRSSHYAYACTTAHRSGSAFCPLPWPLSSCPCPLPGADGIDTLILLDRTMDMATPMCTQAGRERRGQLMRVQAGNGGGQ